MNIKKEMKKNNTKIKKILTITILALAISSLTVFAEDANTTNVTVENETSTETNTASTPNSTPNQTTNTVKQNTTSSNNANSTNTTSNKSNVDNSKKTSTYKTTNTNTVSNNEVTEAQTNIKSSNANLSNLGITPHDFSGFKESKTEYNVTVPNTISEVQVYATKKDSNATITGTGSVKLEEGKNVVKVVVTAEDGTTKTYTINIKRLKEGEKETTTASNSGLGLEKLEIKGLNLEPSFDQNTYQYTVNYEGEEKKLDITAKANKEDAGVKIIGNDNLINGENIITILVVDPDGESVDTYQIYLNKNVIDQAELNRQIDEAQMQYQIKLWIVIILIIIIVICMIILLVGIYKKTNSKEYKEAKQQKKESNKENKKNSKNKKSGRHSK